MQEAAAFPAHRVFVAAREVEGPPREARKIDRPRHEAVIAVDHQRGVACRIGQRLQPLQREAGGEEDLRDPDQVEAVLRGGDQPVEAGGVRGGGDARDRHQPVFLQPRELAGQGMEFGIGGQDAGRPAGRQGREDPQQEIMGVRREDQRGGVGQRQLAGDLRAEIRQHRSQHLGPFPVLQPRGGVPGLDLGGAGHVGPGVVAVGGDMQPRGIGGEEAGEMGAQIQHGVDMRPGWRLG